MSEKAAHPENDLNPTSSTNVRDIMNVLQKKTDDRHSKELLMSPSRRWVTRIVRSQAFEWSMAFLIFLNVVFVILEVDWNASGSNLPEWLRVCNVLVMLVYFFEICARLYSSRLDFFKDPFSAVDFTVVSIDIAVTLVVVIWEHSFPLPSVLARVARVMKVTRAIRMMTAFPELNFMLKGMLFASRSIFWGVLMLFMTLCFWAILAVLFIYPVSQEMTEQGVWEADHPDCERCPRAFENVAGAMLTLCQQLVVGEGWNDVNTAMIEYSPPTAIYFGLVLITTVLAVLNMLMGVIVERATEAKAASLRDEAAKKDRDFQAAGAQLLDICRSLDADSSGRLTFDELRGGSESNTDFANILRTMDIDPADLQVVFNMLDTDGSGDVEYEEFVHQLHMMKTREPHTLLIFIKFYVMEIRNKLEGHKASRRASATAFEGRRSTAAEPHWPGDTVLTPMTPMDSQQTPSVVSDASI